jgi:hypothetical protein
MRRNKNQLFFTVPTNIRLFLEDQIKDNPHTNMSNLVRSYFVKGFGIERYGLVKGGLQDYGKDHNQSN